MRTSKQIGWGILFIASVTPVALACEGSRGGGYGDLIVWESGGTTFERASSTLERGGTTRESQTSTNEGVAGTAEPASGAQGARGAGAGGAVTFNGVECTGSYLCTEVGERNNDTSRVTLVLTEQGCSVSGLLLTLDGRVLRNGNAVGTWSAGAAGVTVTTGNDTVTCVPTTATTSTATATGTARPPTTATSTPGTATANPPPSSSQ